MPRRRASSRKISASLEETILCYTNNRMDDSMHKEKGQTKEEYR